MGLRTRLSDGLRPLLGRVLGYGESAGGVGETPGGTVLLESGDRLLLESGDLVLLDL